MPLRPLDRWVNQRLGRPADGPPPSTDELRRWQMERLRRTLAHAKERSPFYRHQLAHITPESLCATAHMERVPRLEPHILRERPQDLLCSSQDDVARAVTLSSSGSSGLPKRLFFTAGDLERTTDFFRHGMAQFIAPGDSVLAILPASRPGGVSHILGDAVTRCGGAVHTAADPTDIPSICRTVLDAKVRCIVGPPVHVLAIARLLRAWKTDSPVHAALLCWDTVHDTVASAITKALGCVTFRHWGMTETCLGGGVDCLLGTGMHLRAPDLFCEVTDPVTGAPVPDGADGELVLTTLSRRAMPLIRYRTGDIARIAPGVCPCGSPLPRLEALSGRLDGGIPLPGNTRLTMGDIDRVALALPGVLDVTATYDPPSATLTVHLYTTGEHAVPPRCSTLTTALSALPAISNAMDAGGMRLCASVEASDGTIATAFAKRTIAYRHKEVALP